ncbi:MAG: endonuclease/exonuclease/phosphatase family protein [Proteobacteria bacterium]|nr:endonuclease/exonuclease/phosphatase family protein [Pseudomonadota bacterium]
MKLIAWNVNHRARGKAIPPAMAEALAFLAPDLIVLTEYVPSRSHADFVAALSLNGFPYLLVSAYRPKENHVLIASRASLQLGEIEAPAIAPSLPSNVLHVQAPDYELEVLGIRVPDYSKTPPLRHACWDWIETVAARVKDRPFVLAGDLNVDPSYPPSKCGNRLRNLTALGWRHALPSEGVSYRPFAGNSGQRLDHAFVCGPLSIMDARYVWEAGPYSFGGRHSGAMSDHAALVVEIGKRQSQHEHDPNA